MPCNEQNASLSMLYNKIQNTTTDQQSWHDIKDRNMQQETYVAPYGITKVEFAKRLQEQETRNAPRRDSLFTRLRNKLQ